MTEEHDTHRATDAEANVADAAEEIATEEQDVRERSRRLMVELFRDRRVSLRELSRYGGDMVDGALRGVRELPGDRQDGVLKDVVNGLADGMTTAANATRLALEEAAGRGETFAKEDVERLAGDLEAIERMFVDSVSDAAKRAGDTAGAGIKDLRSHAERAFESMRPAVESALRTARKHPVKLAGETVTATAKAVPLAAGALLHSVSGLLQGAGDLLRNEPRSGETRSGDTPR